MSLLPFDVANIRADGFVEGLQAARDDEARRDEHEEMREAIEEEIRAEVTEEISEELRTQNLINEQREKITWLESETIRLTQDLEATRLLVLAQSTPPALPEVEPEILAEVTEPTAAEVVPESEAVPLVAETEVKKSRVNWM